MAAPHVCCLPPQSVQSVPRLHWCVVLPEPPSSHTPSLANEQLSKHICMLPPTQLAWIMRVPQSAQSWPTSHCRNFEPGPPSSQTPSPVCMPHIFLQRNELCLLSRLCLQSLQSVPRPQYPLADPGPPSSHSPSSAYRHVSWQRQPLLLSHPALAIVEVVATTSRRRQRATIGLPLGAGVRASSPVPASHSARRPDRQVVLPAA